MEQFLTFSADLTASETDRTISGKIVPLGAEVGNTSVGKVIFERGSISVEQGKTIKLLSQHDVKKPIGKMKSMEITDDAIYATFSISKSQRGNDALILAAEGLESGLSVGVDVLASKPKQGILYVTKASLQEVSLVTEPAFKSAQVTDIAASEEETPEVAEETTQTESEQSVEEKTTDTVAAPEIEASAVEAARPTVAVTSVRERVKPISSAEYLGATIKAAVFNDEDARRTILAADDSTATNTGLTLPSHLTSFITTTFSGRPAFDAVTRAGAVPQLSFTVPKMGTAPTIATTAEGAAPSETGMTSSYDTVTAVKKSGLQRISFELLDFSNPAFETILMSELRKAYEKDSDNYVLSALATSGTAATGVAATAAGLQSFIATESAAAYKGTGGDYANKLLASTDQWAAIMGYVDGAQRPLYTVASPQFNASGQITPTSSVGNVLGTDLIVDHNISTVGVVDDSAFLVAPNAVWVWESPTTNLRVNVLTSGEVEINMYGYVAVHVGKPLGVRRFNLA